MKIYDCFTFFDEKMLLEFRLNYLSAYVDKFVIAEANYTHSGNPKKLNFNINDYPKFKDKIIYIPITKKPGSLHNINSQKVKNIQYFVQIFFFQLKNTTVFFLLKMVVGILLILKHQKKYIINFQIIYTIENLSIVILL